MEFQQWLLGRAYYITGLTSNLYDFIQRKGYAWGISEMHLRNCIATGLYENDGVSCLNSSWAYSHINTTYSEDDKIHYDYIMNEEVWEHFWQTVDTEGCDLDLNEHRGWDRRIDIQHFVWEQIDLAKSGQSCELDEIIRGGEEDDDLQNSRKQGYDTYLQESVEYSGWGGYRK